MKVLDLTKKEKHRIPEVAKVYVKNETSTCEVVKMEKEICASFAVEPQTVNVTPTGGEFEA